jgi:hypothetical protein
MAKIGKLTCRDGYYGLSGVGNGAGHYYEQGR